MHLSRFARLLSPVFGLAAFVVLLITFMTPTLILKERSSLFVVKGSSTASKMVRRQYELTVIPSTTRFVRIRRATKSTATETQSDDVQINIGMLGACYAIGKASNCTSASFTPIFLGVYSQASLSTSAQAALPDQFPLVPTITFLSILLVLLSLFCATFACIPLHSKALVKIQPLQTRMKRFGLICGVIGAISGIVSAIALRIQLESAATAFNKLASASQASVSSGFDQLWAGWALSLLACIMSLFGYKGDQ